MSRAVARMFRCAAQLPDSQDPTSCHSNTHHSDTQHPAAHHPPTQHPATKELAENGNSAPLRNSSPTGPAHPDTQLFSPSVSQFSGHSLLRASSDTSTEHFATFSKRRSSSAAYQCDRVGSTSPTRWHSHSVLKYQAKVLLSCFLHLLDWVTDIWVIWQAGVKKEWRWFIPMLATLLISQLFPATLLVYKLGTHVRRWYFERWPDWISKPLAFLMGAAGLMPFMNAHYALAHSRTDLAKSAMAIITLSKAGKACLETVPQVFIQSIRIWLRSFGPHRTAPDLIEILSVGLSLLSGVGTAIHGWDGVRVESEGLTRAVQWAYVCICVSVRMMRCILFLLAFYTWTAIAIGGFWMVFASFYAIHNLRLSAHQRSAFETFSAAFNMGVLVFVVHFIAPTPQFEYENYYSNPITVANMFLGWLILVLPPLVYPFESSVLWNSGGNSIHGMCPPAELTEDLLCYDRKMVMWIIGLSVAELLLFMLFQSMHHGQHVCTAKEAAGRESCMSCNELEQSSPPTKELEGEKLYSIIYACRLTDTTRDMIIRSTVGWGTKLTLAEDEDIRKTSISWTQIARNMFGNKEEYYQAWYCLPPCQTIDNMSPCKSGHEDNQGMRERDSDEFVPYSQGRLLKVPVFVAVDAGTPPSCFHTDGCLLGTRATLHFAGSPENPIFVIHSNKWRPFQQRFQAYLNKTYSSIQSQTTCVNDHLYEFPQQSRKDFISESYFGDYCAHIGSGQNEGRVEGSKAKSPEAVVEATYTTCKCCFGLGWCSGWIFASSEFWS